MTMDQSSKANETKESMSNNSAGVAMNKSYDFRQGLNAMIR
jgi:hypothetical protein